MMRYVIVPTALLILLILTSASNNYGASAKTDFAKVMTVSNLIGNQIWMLGNQNDSYLEFGKESAGQSSYHRNTRLEANGCLGHGASRS